MFLCYNFFKPVERTGTILVPHQNVQLTEVNNNHWKFPPSFLVQNGIQITFKFYDFFVMI
jgi:hypothetical protein